MFQSNPPHRGRIQAQGDDIDRHTQGGYSRAWAKEASITRDEGICFLEELEQECQPRELARRTKAFLKAKNFIRRAAQGGGVGPESQPPSFIDQKNDIKNARVDIEIRKGLAFIPPPDELRNEYVD
ncbi:MAG: hypothetical protein HC799_17530 [Limnothrix sp. RL_2_0]|nr:hypothetical protein [Limnothrix sp. RL_2_0]